MNKKGKRSKTHHDRPPKARHINASGLVMKAQQDSSPRGLPAAVRSSVTKQVERSDVPQIVHPIALINLQHFSDDALLTHANKEGVSFT